MKRNNNIFKNFNLNFFRYLFNCFEGKFQIGRSLYKVGCTLTKWAVFGVQDRSEINVKLPHFGRVSNVAVNPFDVSEHLGPWGRRNGYVMLCLNSWPIHPHLSGLFGSWGNL